VLAHGFLPTVIGSEAYRKKIIAEDETFTKQFVAEKGEVYLVPLQHLYVASLTLVMLRCTIRSSRNERAHDSCHLQIFRAE